MRASRTMLLVLMGVLIGLVSASDGWARLGVIPGKNPPKATATPDPTPVVTAPPLAPPTATPNYVVEVPPIRSCENSAPGTCEFRIEMCRPAPEFGAGWQWCWINLYIKLEENSNVCVKVTEDGHPFFAKLQQLVWEGDLVFNIHRQKQDDGMWYAVGPNLDGNNAHIVNTWDPTFPNVECGMRYQFDALPEIGGYCPVDADLEILDLLSEFGCERVQGKVVEILAPPCPPRAYASFKSR